MQINFCQKQSGRFFFISTVSLQCFFLSHCSVQPHRRLSGDLLLSRAPRQIPCIRTSCFCSATRKLYSDICLISAHLHGKDVSQAVRTSWFGLFAWFLTYKRDYSPFLFLFLRGGGFKICLSSQMSKKRCRQIRNFVKIYINFRLLLS